MMSDQTAETVRQALVRPLHSCFRSELLHAGFDVRVESPAVRLVPADSGAAPERLPDELEREYWLRWVEWPDGFCLSDLSAPPDRLLELWTGLFGSDARAPWHDRAVRRFLLHLTPVIVGNAMYTTAWRKPDIDPPGRSAYFAKCAYRMRSTLFSTGRALPPCIRLPLGALLPPDGRDGKCLELPGIRRRSGKKKSA